MSIEPLHNEDPGITNDSEDFIVKLDFVLSGFHCKKQESELTETESSLKKQTNKQTNKTELYKNYFKNKRDQIGVS